GSSVCGHGGIGLRIDALNLEQARTENREHGDDNDQAGPQSPADQALMAGHDAPPTFVSGLAGAGEPITSPRDRSKNTGDAPGTMPSSIAACAIDDGLRSWATSDASASCCVVSALDC